MRRQMMFGLLALALAAPVSAQTSLGSRGSIDAQGEAVTIDTVAAPSVVLTISGTWTGTLEIEGQADGTTTFWPVLALKVADSTTAASTTANGLFCVPNPGFLQLRVRASAWTDGTATVTSARGFGCTTLARSGGGGASGSSATLGTTSAATVVYTDKGTPSNPTDGGWWAECSGTAGVDRECAVKINDAGQVFAIAQARPPQ